MKRTLTGVLALVGLVAATTGAWGAGSAVALNGTSRHHAVRHGQLQGVAATTNIVSSPADDSACVTATACTSYRLTLTLPRGQKRSLLTVDVHAPVPSPSGPFVLRLRDTQGKVVATGTDGYAYIGDSDSEQGSHLLARVAPGRYVVQIALMAGSASYTAEFDWRAVSPRSWRRPRTRP